MGQVDSPVELIDVFPTLCDLSGLPIPTQLQGHSLLPLLSGHPNAVRKGAITLNDAWWSKPGWGWSSAPNGKQALGYSYRTDQYRYTQWVMYKPSKSSIEEKWEPTGESAGVELFDYAVDPNETINLAHNKSYSGIVRRLSLELREQCDGCERLKSCTRGAEVG